jgi:hypothetical protein
MVFSVFGSDSTPGFIPTIPDDKNSSRFRDMAQRFDNRLRSEDQRRRDTDRAYDEEFPTIGEATTEGRLRYRAVCDDPVMRDDTPPRRGWF